MLAGQHPQHGRVSCIPQHPDLLFGDDQNASERLRATEDERNGPEEVFDHLVKLRRRLLALGA
jgi:hypothetical protein